VYFDTNEAILRVCKEAGWPAPTPTQIMKTVAMA
jgi:small conductance mechanosensitive channel